MNRNRCWVLAVATGLLWGNALPAMAATHTVNQVGTTFVPSTLTITAGDTVQWVWSSASHTVTEGVPCTPSGGFSQSLNSGNPLVSLTFNTPGVVDYFCIPHCAVGMTGVITVEAAPIPTVSEWGLIALTALLLAGGAVLIARRRRAAAQTG